MLQKSKIILLLVCLGIIIPVFFADASISWSYDIGSMVFEKITNIQLPDLPGPDMPSAKGTANAFLLVIFGLLHVIGLAFLAIAGSFLSIVNSPDFISLGYTQNNPFVIHGWTLVRDLSNMFFILFLVFIALGSTLRIKEYELKKILPTLTGIAILINFTPVICGFIIDASNIIMNTFLSAVGSGIEAAMKTFIEVFDALKDQVNKSGNPLETLGFGIGTIIFVFISAFVFFTFAILFFVRHAALWILVILSPIAFLCYILPQTKKVWSQWWNQFIQWCFVGVIGAFFLYLGEQMLGLKDETFLSPSEGLKEYGGMDQLLPFIIPIIVLIIGFFATIKTSAIGADRVMSFSQGVGKKLGERGKRFAKERVPSKVLKGAERLAAYTPKGKVWKKAYKPFGWAVRRGASAITSIEEAQKADINKFYEEAQKKTPAQNLDTFRNPFATKAEKIAALKAGIEKNQIKDWKKLGFDEKELTKLVIDTGKMAIKIDPKEFSKIRDAFPQLAKDIGKEFDETSRLRAGLMLDKDDITKAGFSSVYEAIVTGLGGDDIKHLDKSNIHKEEFMNAALRNWNGHQIGEAARTFGREFIDEFQKAAETMGRDGLLEPKNFNPNVINYLNSSAAQSLGFSSLGNKVSTEESISYGKTAKEYREKELFKTVAREDILEKDRKELFPEEIEQKQKQKSKKLGKYRSKI